MKRVVLAGIVALASGAILAACLPPLPGPTKSKPSSPTPLPVPRASPEAATATISTLFIEASSTPTLFPTDTFTPDSKFYIHPRQHGNGNGNRSTLTGECHSRNGYGYTRRLR